LQPERYIAECQDVIKVYRTRVSSVNALSGVTARFPAEAITVLAGPSGSGKSTLIRLLAGMDRPDAGRIVVGGVRVDRASLRALRRLRRQQVGVVFQRPSDNFLPHLTVGEHLTMAALSSAERRFAEPEEIAEVLGFSHRLGHRPDELSGGEQARAAMAQVLVGGPSIIVADEPTAELDTVSANHLLDAMDLLVGHGVTFIVSSHDAQVIRHGAQLVELEHGQVRPKRRARAEHFAPRVPSAFPHPPAAAADPMEGRGDVRIHARSLTKTYRRGSENVAALRDATFDVLEGELVGLVGRSGSGKTTLVNIAAGWERPDGGRLSVLGKDPARDVPTWDEVAVLPQQLGMISELTVRENIEYPVRLAGRLPELTWLVDELIDALGLQALQDRYPKETSVGEQQRAGLARALVLSPRLLLADEPTGHQNAEWAEAMFRTLREATTGGTACVAALHDESLLVYADRILAMSDGVLEALPEGA
jgi:putative ABC transport system ATP-binding protein